MKRVPDSELDEDGLCHHDGVPFTGISFSLYPTGELEFEEEHRDGVLWGLHRHYREDGGLLEEGNRVAGHMEGLWRTWHRNGRLKSEAFYHFDCELACIKWDAEGRVIEDIVLEETAPRFQLLMKYREVFGRTEPIPAPPKLPTAEGAAFHEPGGAR